MRRTLCTWFAMTMAAACVALPGKARAAEPETTVELEVDVSALPPDEETEGLRWLLVERQTRVLRDGGIAVVEGDPEEERIRVTVSRYGEGDVNYRFSVALVEHGAVSVERTLTCDLCRDTELVSKVGEEVARISGRFAYEREGAGAGDSGAEPEGSQPAEVEPAPKVRRIGGAGWAGISVAVAGVGFGVGGAVALAKPAMRELTAGRDPYETFTRPRQLGSALVGVGAGLLVAGAVLIAVDQTLLLERRRRRARQLALVPSFSSTGAGLSWSGRF